MLNIVVGYEPREWEAYNVCVDSLVRTSSQKLNIVRLDERELRAKGLYDRPYHVTPAGQYIDDRDGRPFSTGFSFTRFLVPFLGLPKGPVLFVDCDFLFIDDVAGLFSLFDYGRAVQVVKHAHKPPPGMKMDGVAQVAYPRKNWSSCVLWNTAHPQHEILTVHDVNNRVGRDLQNFCWLNDEHIGALPERWNWLAGISPTTGTPDRTVSACHYTEGGPWFEDKQGCFMADEWNAARDAMLDRKPVVVVERRGPGRPKKAA